MDQIMSFKKKINYTWKIKIWQETHLTLGANVMSLDTPCVAAGKSVSYVEQHK